MSAKNTEKMRRELAEIAAELREGIGPTVISIWLSSDKTVGDMERRINGIRRCLADRIEAALAAPMRNCDVGTAKEQRIRHTYWCAENTFCDFSCLTCFSEWAQMPYTEGGGL